MSTRTRNLVVTHRDGLRAARTASVVIAAVMLGSAAVGSADASRAEDGPSSGPRGAAVAKAGAAGAIDTHDKQAVNNAYLSRMAPNLTLPIHWTGSVQGCHAGHPSRRAQAATLESINFVRALGQLAPVSFAKTLSHHAQKAALIMSANNALSHTPPRSWKCWTREGSNAAGHSNLAISWPRITAGGLVTQYMDDQGSSNTAAGHRRWILYPPSLKMGSGTTATANALWVLGPTRQSRPNPAFVAWPTAGWFPAPLNPAGRWSLSAGDDNVDFSNARVVVHTAAGAGRATHKYPVQDGYGKPTLVWHVNNIDAGGTYKVTVKGIKRQGRAAPFAYRYTVRMFTPSH